MTRRDLTSETAADTFDVEAEAKRRGIEPYQVRATQAVGDRLVRDIVSDAYKGIPTSASMIPARQRSEEFPSPKGNGWVDAAPIGPPSGIEHIDRMVAEQTRQDKLVAIKQRMEGAFIEAHFDKGPRIESEYNPFDAKNMKK